MHSNASPARIGSGKTNSIVANLQDQLLVGQRKLDDDGFGLAMFYGVADCLLCDPKEVGGGHVVVHEHEIIAVKEAGDVKGIPKLRAQLA